MESKTFKFNEYELSLIIAALEFSVDKRDQICPLISVSYDGELSLGDMSNLLESLKIIRKGGIIWDT